jgi:RHS repeat-associated protein
MQLTSGVEIPDGLLAAMSQLAENSRQGFGAWSGTVHQGFGFAISSTSLGISGTLYDAGVESRYTGKERDSESGLDYFGARYYGSSMGRWMSPDWAEKPEAVPYSSLDDPQSLNLYQFVRNNPLSNRDSDGHRCPPDCGDPTLATEIAPPPPSLFEKALNFLYFDHPNVTVQIIEIGSAFIGGVSDAPAAPAAIPAAPAATPAEPASSVPESIPAGPGARPSPTQQSKINEMGDTHGCSTCDAKSPGTKTGNWVGDHQPPTKLNPTGQPQVYKPQCLQCSRQQGGQVAAAAKAAAKAAAEAAKKIKTPQ